ncbi:protein kinase domain-containing protein [Apiospora phragmitis]|uniref:Protein kinase domain-containing protein n=1 Tax=Apiospora phragmitis TaxID=2905665 RepID=A0ABR1TNL8_9PEZI
MNALRVPFASLTAERLLARGAGGHVFSISDHVVFKCPTVFHNPTPEQTDEMEESATRIANEKSAHGMLMEHPHPYIVRCILCVPEGFFMERMGATLQARIEHNSACEPPSTHTQARWIRQIASALSWIEGLGHVHGDLRPANILLTADDDIRVADFDASVKTGERLIVASEPFCKLDGDFELPHASPISEQFALASCIYTVRFGHIPLRELDAPSRVQKLINNEFPPTEKDEIFGAVTLSCWQGQYVSIAAVYEDIKSRCDATSASDVVEGSSQKMPNLLAECEGFVARERGIIG